MLISVAVFGWETNTHRAIDRKAIESSVALNTFVADSGISENIYKNEIFETYNTTYFEYIQNGEIDGISKWNHTFTEYNYQDLIEAGTILEDAVWAGGLFSGDGRFNNHFYDPQNGGKGLTMGWGSRTDAVSWAKNGGRNSYSFDLAQRWFANGFTLDNPNERRKYQAKMLVSVGHIMHMLNDMNVPAHTRDDSHPNGDALEWWARGGESGHESMEVCYV